MDFCKICIWDERISIELDDQTLTINTGQGRLGVQRVALRQLELWTISNLHLYELQELIDGKTCNLIKKFLKRLWSQARPGLLQNLTESYRDFIIQVFKSLWKFYCSNIKKLYWNTFLPTLTTMKENKIWMVGNWIITMKKCIFVSNPLVNVIFSGEKQNLMCEEVASRINAINDRFLLEMIYCFYFVLFSLFRFSAFFS